MSETFYLATFSRGHDIVGAANAFRKNGFCLVDAFTPFAVHGLDKAMGLKPSRMMAVSLFFAVIGITFGVWIQYYLSAVAWPINIGGKPWNSVPAFMPIAFEIMVLFIGVGTVFTFLIRSRLRPGKVPKILLKNVTHDAFVLALSRDVAGFDDDLAADICSANHAREIVVRWSNP